MSACRRWFAASLAAVLPLLAAGGAPAQTNADLILTGGKIATLAADGGTAEAIAIGDGVVLAVGSDDEVLSRKGEATNVVELDGRTVIPGLNDSHLHAVRGGRFYNLELRWDGVPTLRRGLEMIRRQAARTPQGHWVRVIGGWTPYQFEEKRMPTIAELNEAAPEVPVMVLFLYSKAFVNRAGAMALGITADTEPPRGGRYRLEDAGAELLAEPSPTILYQAIAALPQLEAEERDNSTVQFYRELNRFGLTSAIDPGGGGHEFPGDYASTERLAERGELPLRLALFLFPQRPGRELEDFGQWTASRKPGAELAGARRGGYVLRGGGETLVSSAGDYENFLAPRPVLERAMDRQLEAVASLLVEKRWPFRIHATYGESIDRILDVLERVAARRAFDGLRWAIDHAETIRPEQIARIARLGGGVAIQDRMAFAGEQFAERYGEAAAATAPPLRELLASGIPLAAGSDATRVSSYNPWLSLYWMVSGKTVGGTALRPPEQRLSRLQALRLYTTGSAWLSGDEDRKGTLEPGRLADLAVLSADYFAVPEESIRGIESVLTIVGGVPVYGAGEYADLAPAPPPVVPAWSPVAEFGGYQR